MVKSSLLEILKTLSLKEFKEFGEFVKSPFFNKNEAVRKLYDFISLRFPNFNGDNFSKENVYSAIFPKADYNDGFMRTIMFNLTKLAEDFIAYNEFKLKELPEQVYLLKALNKRDLNKQFSRNLKLASDNLEKNKIHDEFYFYDKFRLEYEKNVSDFKNMRFLNQKDIPEEEIKNQSDYLINYFILQLLKRYRTLLNLRHVIEFEFEKPFLNEVMHFIKSYPDKFKDVPLAELLYNEIKLFESDNEKYYNNIKKLVTDLSKRFDRSERYNGLVVISNYCLKKHHEGDRTKLTEFTEITEFMFENKIDTMNEGEDLPINYFRTVLLMALAAGKFEWTIRFVKESKSRLSPALRDNAYNFAMARIEFAGKNFNSSMKYLSRVQYDDIYYKFSGKTLQAQLYYELEMLNELADHLDSYRKFLVNNKTLTGLHRKVNENFVKILNDLLKLRSNTGRVKAQQLREKINSTKELTGRGWLLKNIQEIEKNGN